MTSPNGQVDLEEMRALIGGEWGPAYLARLPGGRQHLVPRLYKRYTPWAGEPGQFATPPVPGKTLYEHGGAPNWREFIILRSLERGGWQGVWVKNFGGHGRIMWRDLLKTAELPPAAELTLRLIDDGLAERGQLPSRGGGVWDVLVSRDKEVLFVEDKLRTAANLNENQLRFLDVALDLESPPAFLIVEAR